MPKLTLNADSDIIAQAKRLAAENGTSVSDMFSRFIRSLTHRGSRTSSVGRLTQKATGVIRLPGDEQETDILADALKSKYALA